MTQSIGSVEIALEERRSLEGALADLAAKYERCKTPELARMIKEIEAEITLRRRKVELRSARKGLRSSAVDAVGQLVVFDGHTKQLLA